MNVLIKEANLEYEAEIKRDPGSISLWFGYLDASKSSSYKVSPHRDIFI